MLLKRLSSSRITVISLFLLFILTFWGTIAQVQQGLYAAQDRFFNSFFFLAGGFIPFPGAQLVLWVLFINLMCVTILSVKKYLHWKYAGILITHLGLILYFVAAFMVFHVSQESSIHLAEGQETNISMSYQDWELSYWTGDSAERQVHAFDTKFFKPDFEIPSNNKDFILRVKEFYPNSEALGDAQEKRDANVLNNSGISTIIAKPLLKEKEQNIAGGVFDLRFNNQSHDLILSGVESRPTVVDIAGKKYSFILRHQQFQLPFTLRLDKFKAEFLPGTEMAKNYESAVTVSTGSLVRQARIYMNNPLKYKDYTIYQASYNTDDKGRKYSTLAVVKNFAKFLPYVACLVVFVGLALHYLMQALMAKVKK